MEIEIKDLMANRVRVKKWTSGRTNPEYSNLQSWQPNPVVCTLRHGSSYLDLKAEYFSPEVTNDSYGSEPTNTICKIVHIRRDSATIVDNLTPATLLPTIDWGGSTFIEYSKFGNIDIDATDQANAQEFSRIYYCAGYRVLSGGTYKWPTLQVSSKAYYSEGNFHIVHVASTVMLESQHPSVSGMQELGNIVFPTSKTFGDGVFELNFAYHKSLVVYENTELGESEDEDGICMDVSSDVVGGYGWDDKNEFSYTFRNVVTQPVDLSEISERIEEIDSAIEDLEGEIEDIPGEIDTAVAEATAEILSAQASLFVAR